MSKAKKKGRGMFVLLCVGAFIVAFAGSVMFKMFHMPAELMQYSVAWSEKTGQGYTELSYGDGTANKFDLYVPADNSKDSYGTIKLTSGRSAYKFEHNSN